jgi:hypothetical protein
VKALKMAVVFGECGRECLSGPGNTGFEFVSRKVTGKMWRPIWILIFMVIIAAALKFDCSEEESKYYMEHKLARQ